MRVMGIDLSTKTGIAVIEYTDTLFTKMMNGGDDHSKAKFLLAEEFEFDADTGLDRCHNIAEYILDKHLAHAPNLVVIEGYGYANAHTLATLVELGTVVRYTLWCHGIKFIDVAPNALKKFVTGKGNAPKDLLMLNLYKRFGFSATTNNIADAAGLSYFGLCKLCPFLFTLTQQKCVETTFKTKTTKKKSPA